MGEIYFPSCNFTKPVPKLQRLRAYLKEKMPVAGCCRIDSDFLSCGEYRPVLLPGLPGNSGGKAGKPVDFGKPFCLAGSTGGLSLAGLQRPYGKHPGLLADREHPEIFQGVRSVLQKAERESCGTDGKSRAILLLREFTFPTGKAGKYRLAEALARYAAVPAARGYPKTTDGRTGRKNILVLLQWPTATAALRAFCWAAAGAFT